MEHGANNDADVDAEDAEDEVNAVEAENASDVGQGEARDSDVQQAPGPSCSVLDSPGMSTRPPPRRSSARHQPSNGETSTFTCPTPRHRNQQSNAEASTSTRRPSCGLMLPDDSDNWDPDDKWAHNDSEDWQNVLQYLHNPMDLSDSGLSSGSNPGSMVSTPFVPSHIPSLFNHSPTFHPSSMGSTPFVQSQQAMPVHRMVTQNPSLLDMNGCPVQVPGEVPNVTAYPSTMHQYSTVGPNNVVPTVDDTPTGGAGGVVSRDVDSTLQETPAAPPAPPPINPDPSRGVVPHDVNSTLREMPAGPPAPPPINLDPSRGVGPRDINLML